MLSSLRFAAGRVNQAGSQQRNMATLSDIALRLKSVKGIQKITSSMKMVSAAKFSKAERDLAAGRAFLGSPLALAEKNEVQVEGSDKGKLIVAVSSDRGLCGGCHSYITKKVKPMIDEDPEAKVVIIGDKVRGQLMRNYADSMKFCITEAGKRPTTFEEASSIANEISKQGIEWTKGAIVYNVFQSAIAYETTVTPLFSSATIESNPKLSNYELESDDVANFQEYLLASTIYGAMLEAKASEESARMSAMDNATKNAGEMIDSLSLLYNRTRQAVITNELIEIISGAAAV